MPWIMLNDSFLSIVADPTRKDTLVVRARKRGHIEKVFPGAKVQTLPNRDYAFRANLPRQQVADAIASRVLNTAERNFKDSVKEKPLHDAYMRVWGVMADYQEDSGHGRPYETTRTGKGPKRKRRWRPSREDREFYGSQGLLPGTTGDAVLDMGGDYYDFLAAEEGGHYDRMASEWEPDEGLADESDGWAGPTHRKR